MGTFGGVLGTTDDNTASPNYPARHVSSRRIARLLEAHDYDVMIDPDAYSVSGT
jgi:hypothetical protein